MPKVLVTYTVEETVEVEVTDEQYTAMQQPWNEEKGSALAIDHCLNTAALSRLSGLGNTCWVSTTICGGEDYEEELYEIS